MVSHHETISAIATPPGTGGIGIVRLSGKQSLTIAEQITSLDAIAPRQAHYSRFRDLSGRVIDTGILLYFPAPGSFTGEDVVELHGHGGRVVLNMLLQETINRGARLARAGEFTERAYLNDRIDLVQAEAVADLIDSVSEQAARSAARSLEGEFSNLIDKLVEELIAVRVFVESSLDFPEEEIDFLKTSDLKLRLQKLVTEIEGLLIKSRKGSLLKSGVRIAIIGRPNVGKSSLLNKLSGTERAIVTHVPGTTRDIIENVILVEGVPVNIIDTAGIRTPEENIDVVEQEGIRRSNTEIEKADLIIVVTDTEYADDFVTGMLEKSNLGKLIVVHNKIDLYNRKPDREMKDEVPRIYLSAKTGDGLGLLKQVIGDLAGLAEAGEDVILARERHISALASAREYILTGLEVYKTAGSAELLAEELRKAQHSLGEITGEFHSEDLLGEIFSRFCIGK